MDKEITNINSQTGGNIPDGLPIPSRYWAILAIGLGVTVSVLDGAIANVALPTIAGDLHTSPSASIWVVNAYQLAITISLLSLSSMGEIWGYRKVYTIGLLLFSCTSLACALSDSLFTLIIARTLQGFGAAAIASVNTAAGPTIAAGILSVGNWPWLFAINIPIGITALILSFKFLPQNPVKAVGRKFDVTAALMNALTFGLVIAIIEAFTHDVHISLIIAAIVIVLFCGYFYVRREERQAYPLLPIDLLRIPLFTLSIITSVFSFIAQMLAMVSFPFFLQRVLGRDEVATGLLLTPWPLATMVCAPLAGILSEKMNAGVLSGIGLIIFSGGLFSLAELPAHPSDLDIIWRMALCGCGFGLFQTPNNSLMIGAAPESRSGGASGMLGTARLLGQTCGASLVALMFKLFPGHSMPAALWLGSVLALIGAVISFSRINRKA